MSEPFDENWWLQQMQQIQNDPDLIGLLDQDMAPAGAGFRGEHVAQPLPYAPSMTSVVTASAPANLTTSVIARTTPHHPSQPMSTNTTATITRFSCTTCDKTFTRAGSRDRHVKENHAANRLRLFCFGSGTSFAYTYIAEEVLFEVCASKSYDAGFARVEQMMAHLVRRHGLTMAEARKAAGKMEFMTMSQRDDLRHSLSDEDRKNWVSNLLSDDA